MSNVSPTSIHAITAHQPAGSPLSQNGSSASSLPSLPSMAESLASPVLATNPEKHPKGKRKRTAAKDKMILEEAYSSNPKPDKHARLEIVARVSLNEKEVQIWFQNRRQNDRRKSRPLSPQEIAALRYGGMHVISSDPTSSAPLAHENSPVSDPASGSPEYQLHATPSVSRSLSRSHSDIVHSTPFSASQESVPRDPPLVTPGSRQTQQTPSSQQSRDGTQSLSNSMSNSIGYLANRWNLGSSFSTPSTVGRESNGCFRSGSFPPSSCSSERSQAEYQSRSQSKVRLSLSLEGKAELVSNQASPTRQPPARPSSTAPSMLFNERQRSLQRSHSAPRSITLPPISTLTNSLPPQLLRGRSRDVQAWESCADAERRDELTAQAENESNGSAIAAISLLRSSSGISSSGILQPSGAKRNAPMSRPLGAQLSKKAKLGRTISSVGRLESVVSEKKNPVEPALAKVKVSMLVSPSGDSDKENWSPDEDGNPLDAHSRRPLPSAVAKPQNPRRLGRGLQESKSPSFLASRANTAPARHSKLDKGPIKIYQDSPKSVTASRDDEVEQFMRGEVSPSKKGDMDCVAGLLSLSKGGW